MKGKIYLYLCVTMFLSSCGGYNNSSQQNDNKDSVDEEVFQTQEEFNEASYESYIADEDSVEDVYQQLLEALPQYQSEFQKETKVWETYKKAIREIAGYEDHGSSSPMYVNDVLRQGLKLRGVSLYYLYLHEQGKDTNGYSKTTFTQDMIDDAYAAFIKAVGEKEYNDQKEQYQEALRQEQNCWNEWMQCRKSISQNLTGEQKNLYDISTNQMFRTKLYQLKNQNQDLGMASGEVFDCALPMDCSDKALLNYPGFDVVWAKHCKDLDWYPTFE